MIKLEEAIEELRYEMEMYKQSFDKHTEHIDSMLKEIIYMVKDGKDNGS